MRDLQRLRCLSGGDIPVFPASFDLAEPSRPLHGPASEMYALRFGRRDPFRLPLPYELPLRLRNIRQKLQNDVRDQRSGQVAASPRIQQRHVQHDDGDRFFLRQQPPLLQDLLIISAEAVNALDNQRVAAFQPAHEAFVLRPLKILSGLLVHKDLLFPYPEALQSDELPLLVLLLRRYPCVTVIHVFTSDSSI